MNVLPWLALKNVSGVGNQIFKRLIDRFSSPEAVFGASSKELIKISGISERLADKIRQSKVTDAIRRELDLTLEKGFRILTLTDPDYPSLLLQIPDPPPFLYTCGTVDNQADNLAVVGSRNATSYGLSAARRLCRDLGNMNFQIVSGMARGIDTAAHEGALNGQGRTIAVLGSGLGNIYPRENVKLFHRITENGTVISEFPVMAGPEAHHFPLRNRIICGIALGTIVVEAAKKSGSLITARLAADQGREVFAVPGSIYSYKSTGPHSLIKEGAKLVENACDIVEEIKHVMRNPDTAGCRANPEAVDTLKSTATENRIKLNADESSVLQVLEPYPMHIDDICRKLPFEPGKLSGILLKLELNGRVKQSPGKRFSVSEELP